ncbi:hypothetical protein D3C87_1983130 [compost metagenome]
MARIHDLGDDVSDINILLRRIDRLDAQSADGFIPAFRQVIIRHIGFAHQEKQTGRTDNDTCRQ